MSGVGHGSSYAGHGKYMPQHQPDAVINQAAPVQNTWYTVLAANDDVIVISAEMQVAVAAETLECEIVVDGNTLVGAQAAAVAATPYYLSLAGAVANALQATIVDPLLTRAYLIEGQNIRVRIRKTTAAGANNISAIVKWARLLPT